MPAPVIVVPDKVKGVDWGIVSIPGSFGLDSPDPDMATYGIELCTTILPTA